MSITERNIEEKKLFSCLGRFPISPNGEKGLVTQYRIFEIDTEGAKREIVTVCGCPFLVGNRRCGNPNDKNYLFLLKRRCYLANTKEEINLVLNSAITKD